MATNHFLGVRIPHGVLRQTKTCSLCEHKEKRKLVQCCGSFSILTTKFGKNIATKLCLMKPRILLGASSTKFEPLLYLFYINIQTRCSEVRLSYLIWDQVIASSNLAT